MAVLPALVLLVAAASRKDRHLLPSQACVKAHGATLEKVLASMLRRGLVEEVSTSRADAAWRTDEAGNRTTLAATDAGLAAAGIGADADHDVGADDATEENASDTDDALNMEVAPASIATADRTSDQKVALRPGTKGAAVLGLLQRTDGATVEEMQAATGWQAHSVRGFLSGTVKRKLGLTVASERNTDGVRHYWIERAEREAEVRS